MTQGWRQILILICSFTLIECANIFEPLAPKDTNPALLYEARKEIDAGKYVSALTYLAQITPEYGANNDVRITYASAYAGACGMEFIAFFNSISQANLSPPNTIFKYLRNSFTNKATTPNYCVSAEAKLKEIGTTEALRLAAMYGKKEVNMLMAILAMAKVGSILRTKSDVDGASLLGDGITDADFNSCSTDKISDNEVLEVATGFGLFIENLPTLLGASNSTSVALTAVTTVIGVICSPSAPSTGCVILDHNALSNSQKTGIIETYRDILESVDVGIGLTCTPLTNICCP